MSTHLTNWQQGIGTPAKPYIMAITDPRAVGMSTAGLKCVVTAGTPSGGGPFWPAGITSADADDRAALIAAAVNACIEINPENPMAAAEAMPDLLEACKSVFAGLQAKADIRGSQWTVTDQEDYETLRAAIKKAEGRL